MINSQYIYTFSQFLKYIFISKLNYLLLHNKHLPNIFNSKQKQYINTKPIYLQNLYLNIYIY